MHFDARVEPFWYWQVREKKTLGFFEGRRRRKRQEGIARAIHAALAGMGADPGDWDARSGETVCNLRLDRGAVLQDLRVFAASLDRQSATEIYQGNAQSRFLHLIKNRDRESYYLPVPFPEPIMVLVSDTKQFIPVGSSVRLLKELQEINRDLRVEATFKIKKMVDFFQASEDDILQYEARLGNDPNFWVKFGFVLMEKLARKSVESRLPVIFA